MRVPEKGSTAASSSATCSGSPTGGRRSGRCSAVPAWRTCTALRRSASAGRSTSSCFVSDHFDGVPWLERVYQASSLWDAYEMGGQADVHCYTPAEFERKREGMRVVRDAAEHGLELLPAAT